MAAAANARWVLLSQSVRILSQLISITVLARLLPPRAYGIMALALVVMNLANLFRDLGTSAAIIQAEKLSNSLKNTVHWSNVALGVVVGLGVTISAPIMALAFREPQLRSVLLLVALVFPVSAFSLAHQALLERESRFSRVVLAEIVSSLSGVVAAILAAIAGAGVFSLALQLIVAAVVATALILKNSDFKPAWQWCRSDFNSIVHFSGNLSLFNFINYFIRNADSMVIGRVLGAIPLGIYFMAYRIMLFPVQNLSYVATRALFPVMSRNVERPQQIAELYLKSVGLISLVSAPLMAGLFALRELFVTTVLGDKWHAAIVILAWLAPIGFIQSLVSTSGAVSMARGRTDQLVRLSLLSATVQLPAFIIGARWGLQGVAACYLLANILLAFPTFHFIGALVGVTVRMLLRTVGMSVILSMAMALLLALVKGPVAAVVGDGRLQLAILVLAGAAFYYLAGKRFLGSQIKSLRMLVAIPKAGESVA